MHLKTLVILKELTMHLRVSCLLFRAVSLDRETPGQIRMQFQTTFLWVRFWGQKWKSDCGEEDVKKEKILG